MHHFQGEEYGYGDDGSLVLSLDGWFAFKMNQTKLAEVKGDVAFIQMNGHIYDALKDKDDNFYTADCVGNDYNAKDFLVIDKNKPDYIDYCTPLDL